MFVKQCRVCRKYFPSKLKSYIDYCPKCWLTHKDYFPTSIKRTRSISVDHFDVFNTDFPTSKKSWYQYERVCRICGKRLLTKKGLYNHRKRYCNKLCSASEIWFSWGDTRWRYIQSKIKEENSLDKNPYYCELCNKHLNYYNDRIEVHHKIPVHTLIFEQLNLIWDFDNLIMLCHDCHRKQDHKRKKKPKLPIKIKKKNWKKISSFLNVQSLDTK